MRGKAFFDTLVDTNKELKVDMKDRPYGFVCSEDTANLLKEYFKDISGQPAPALVTVSGLKVMAIKDYPFYDMIIMLDRENYEEVERNGIVSLIRKMAKTSNIKLWGLDGYHGDIAGVVLR